MKKELIIKVCGWCKKPMGFLSRLLWILRIKCKLSHGICWNCHKVELKKLFDPSRNSRHPSFRLSRPTAAFTRPPEG